MGWNGSNLKGTAQVEPQPKTAKPSPVRGIVAGLAVVLIAVVAAWFFVFNDSTESVPTSKQDKPKTLTETASAKSATLPTASPKAVKSAAEIAKAANERAKDFIKKSAATNNIIWIVPPMDPNDPDRALSVRVNQELTTLLAVEPGEQMIPFPFSFLAEDEVGRTGDGGNKEFLESLKKFKIQAKETDGERRLDHKANLISAQQELLKGIDEGLSVNDSIRAAYEFRVRAYEMRKTIIDTLAEYYAQDGNIEATKKDIKEMNERLAEEGIKTIDIENVIPDYEEEENPNE